MKFINEKKDLIPKLNKHFSDVIDDCIIMFGTTEILKTLSPNINVLCIKELKIFLSKYNKVVYNKNGLELTIYNKNILYNYIYQGDSVEAFIYKIN